MNYELIADSGSTKTDWALLCDGRLVTTAHTAGLNPFQMSGAEIEAELRSALLPALAAALDAQASPASPSPAPVSSAPASSASPSSAPASSGSASPSMPRVAYAAAMRRPSPPVQPSPSVLPALSVRFYGAGCTPEKQPVVERALRAALPAIDTCEVASDMLGAARAVCGDRPGICCILGTGSNSCAYDGRRIVKNVPPLGFILGDEGSGAVMGRTLVADVLKGLMPQHIRDRFFEKYRLTQADIIERVYRQPKPNTFLASFMPFIEENIGEPAVAALVADAFRAFLSRNVMQYDGWRSLPIGFVGSVACIYRQQLEAAMKECGMTLGRIVRRPLDALCG